MKQLRTLSILALMFVFSLVDVKAATTTIFTEDFEAPALSFKAGWTQTHVFETYDWTVRTGISPLNPINAHGGTQNAGFYHCGEATTRLVTPKIDFTAQLGGNAKLTFWRAQMAKSAQIDTLRVYYSTDSAKTWIKIADFNDATTGWKADTLDLPSISAESFIAFEASTDCRNGVLLDDIHVIVTTPSTGEMTVGTGGTFANFTELFASVKENGLQGDVTAKVISDIVEPSPAVLAKFAAGASLTIESDGDTKTVRGLYEEFTDKALITLDGADNVTFKNLVLENFAMDTVRTRTKTLDIDTTIDTILVTETTIYKDTSIKDTSEDVPPIITDKIVKIVDSIFVKRDSTFKYDTTTTYPITKLDTTKTDGGVVWLKSTGDDGCTDIKFESIEFIAAMGASPSDVSTCIAAIGDDLTKMDGGLGHKNIEVIKSKFYRAKYGIRVKSGSADAEKEITGLKIDENTFGTDVKGMELTEFGVHVENTDGLIVNNNTFVHFTDTDAYAIRSVKNAVNGTDSVRALNIAKVTNNKINNYEGDYGVYLDDNYMVEVSGNTINDLTLESNAIYINNSAKAVVKENVLNKLEMDDSSYPYADHVIYVKGSEESNIEANTITEIDGDNNRYTIYVDASNKSTVKANKITDTEESGMRIYNSDESVVINNDIVEVKGSTYGGYGINVYSSDKVTVDSNKVHGGTANGASIYMSSSKEGKITGNEIYDIDSERCIYITGSDVVALGNKIHDITCSDLVRAFYLYNADKSVIDNNVMNTIKCTSTSTSDGAYAIEFGNGNDDITIQNNIIFDLETKGAGTWNNVMAVRFYYSASKIKFYQNTINLTGTHTNPGATRISAIMGFDDSATDLELKNNIFVNNVSGDAGMKAYMFYANGSFDIKLADAENNVYHFAGDGTKIFARRAATDLTTLADWQAATTKDATSNVASVGFLADNFHIDGPSALNPALVAPKLAGIDKDVDGDERKDDEPTTAGVDQLFSVVEIDTDLTQVPATADYCEGQKVKYNFTIKAIFADSIPRPGVVAFGTKWVRGEDVLDINAIDNMTATNLDLNIDPLQASDAGKYFAKATYFGKEVKTAEKTITVKENVKMLAGGNLPTDFIACEGTGELVLSANFSNEKEVVWQKFNKDADAFEDIADAMKGTYTIDFDDKTAEEAAGEYRLKVTGFAVCDTTHNIVAYSTVAKVTVYKPLVGVIAEAKFTADQVCIGRTLEMEAKVTSGDITGYQWQQFVAGNWTNIEGNPTAKEAMLVLTDIDYNATGRYRVILDGKAPCSSGIISGNAPIEVDVPDVYRLTSQPITKIVCADEQVSLVVKGNEETNNKIKVVSYQWFHDGSVIDPAVNTSADDAILTIGQASHENIGEYTCVVKYDDCRGINVVESNSAFVYVLTKTEIVEQPYSITAQVGQTLSFEVKAHMKGIVPPAYKDDFQWYKGTVALTDNAKFQGTKSSIMTVKNIEASDFANNYHVMVTGKCGASVKSNDFAITKTTTISMVTDPVDVNACENGKVEFITEAKGSATGMTVNYQWMRDGTALVDGANINGATAAKLEILAATAADLGKYSAVATSVFGGNTYTITSAEGELTFKTTTAITTQPAATLSAKEKENDVEIVVAATGTNLTYAWMKDRTVVDVTLNPSAGTKTFKIGKDDLKMTDAGSYTCKVSGDCGEVTSDASVLTVIKGTSNSVDNNQLAGVKLYNVAPNPVQEIAYIKYDLSAASQVKLTISDVTGRVIVEMNQGTVTAGSNNVIEVNVDENNMNSGVYFYTLHVNGQAITKQFVVVK